MPKAQIDKLADQDGLTPKMRGTVEHFILNNNELEAYRANYNCSRMQEATIRRRCREVFADPRIMAAVRKEREKLAKRHDNLADRVVQEHEKLAFAKVTDVVQYRKTGDGRYVMSMTAFDELPEAAKSAIKKVKIKTKCEDVGDGDYQEVQEIEVELYDKQRSLDSLARMQGMFIDKHHVQVDQRQVIFNIDIGGGKTLN